MSWQEIATIAQTLIGTGAIGIGVLVTWRKAHAESSASEAGQIETHMKNQDDRMERLETRLDAAIQRERVMSDYVMELRYFIENRQQPPPPPWPPTLLPAKNG